MTAALIIGIVALIVLSTMGVLALHEIRQSASDAFRALEQRDIRSQRQIADLLDRLMTVRWEDFAAVKAIDDEEEEGGFVRPEEQRDGEGEIEIEDGKWGHLSTLRERLRLTNEEDQLLREDFPDEFSEGAPNP